MSGGQGDLRAAGDRIEALLDELARLPDRRAGQWGEEVVRLVTDLYGAGLQRVLAIAGAPGAPRGEELLRLLAQDELVASLMLVHDLHPAGLRHRVEIAIGEVQTTWPGTDVRVLDFDEDAATARIRVLASGVPPSAVAGVVERVRAEIQAKVPDLEALDVERIVPPTPVRLGRRPDTARAEVG